ncbi:MAG: WYL domain-containing protein, partial [Candidatus Altiarchaeota archaeon]|nr:WYL domain-containing protein [Candidatus Altiarchaeota archaeon]
MKDSPVTTTSYNEEADVDKILSEGGVHARIYLEVQATDTDAAKIAMENTVSNRLLQYENITVLKVSMYDILKEENAEYFSGVSEVEFVADDFRWMINAVLKYGPAAVEIIEPPEVKLPSDMMHSIVADIADFSHLYSQQIIKLLKDPERKALYEKMLGN